MLLPKLADARPLVRSITCWSLSRYARWLVQAAREAGAVGIAQFDSVLAVRAPIWTACCDVCAGSEGSRANLGAPVQAARKAATAGVAQFDSMPAGRGPAQFAHWVQQKRTQLRMCGGWEMRGTPM